MKVDIPKDYIPATKSTLSHLFIPDVLPDGRKASYCNVMDSFNAYPSQKEALSVLNKMRRDHTGDYESGIIEILGMIERLPKKYRASFRSKYRPILVVARYE